MVRKKNTWGHFINEVFPTELGRGSDIEREFGLDYFNGDFSVEYPSDQYSYVTTVTTCGDYEGIYTDFYLNWHPARPEVTIHVATAKTLAESEDAFIRMHEFAAKASLRINKALSEIENDTNNV